MKNLVSFLLLPLTALFSLQACEDSSTGTPEVSVIKVSPNPVSVKAAGGPAQVTCEIANPKEGVAPKATPDKDWVHSFGYSTKDKITFTVDANETYEPRSTEVTVTYDEAESVAFTVSQDAAEAPIKIDVSDISTTAAGITYTPTDPSMTYTLGVTEKSAFEKYADDAEFMEKDLEKLLEESADWGLDFLLYTKEQHFDKSELKENTEYIAFAYGLTGAGKFTTGLVKKSFSTAKLTDCTFELEASDVTIDGATLHITPSRNDVSYHVAYVEKRAFHDDFADDDIQLRDGAIGKIRSMIALSGGTAQWSDFTHTGKTSIPVSMLFPATDYYCFAFGLDAKGSPTTLLYKEPFTTKPEEITDDCTFGIDFTNVGSSLIDVKVSPSNPSTRYYASFLKKSEFDKHTPEENAYLKIAEENGWPIDWANDKKIHSGTQTLNSRYDLAVAPFEAETAYTFFIFGVSLDGKRTTAVATEEVTTSAFKPSDMTIGIAVGEVGNTSCRLTFTPSNDDGLYVTAIIAAETAQYYPNDADLMDAIVNGYGQMISAYTVKGKKEATYEYDMLGNFLTPGTQYVVVAFGYEGGITTGMFKGEFTTTGSAPEWPDWPDEW